jgi:phosphate transport system protein
MERHFDEELARLKRELLEMGALVERAITGSFDALKELEPLSARRIIEDDMAVDRKELIVDELCLDLLALHQPVAHDLRFITMAMKIATDLERMADLAVDIAQRVLELAGKPLLKPLIDIPRLTLVAREMTSDVLDAFLNEDPEKARRVIARDSEADALRDAIQQELVNVYIAKYPGVSPRALPLLLIARHLERICDHATNIAEDVIYMVQAKVVKHHADELPPEGR